MDVFSKAEKISKAFTIEIILVSNNVKSGDDLWLNELKLTKGFDRSSLDYILEILEETKNQFKFFEYECLANRYIFFYSTELLETEIIEKFREIAHKRIKIDDLYNIDFNSVNLLDELDELTDDLTYHRVLGNFYGYPECDIKIFRKDTPGYSESGTEHIWHSNNCIRSKQLKNLYDSTIKKYRPNWINWEHDWDDK